MIEVNRNGYFESFCLEEWFSWFDITIVEATLCGVELLFLAGVVFQHVETDFRQIIRATFQCIDHDLKTKVNFDAIMLKLPHHGRARQKKWRNHQRLTLLLLVREVLPVCHPNLIVADVNRPSVYSVMFTSYTI